jgi:hypothetical protein
VHDCQIFNEKEGNIIDKIYGAVTSGSTWKFLKYENDTAYIDRLEYHIGNVNKIMGIFVKTVHQEPRAGTVRRHVPT